jgi:hypothetical protein
VATIVYYHARERGLPDVLEADRITAVVSKRTAATWIKQLGLAAGKAWLAGFQAFIFTRGCCHFLAKPGRGARQRLLRFTVVALGLTLFGVSTSQHVLRRAGLSGRQLVEVGFLGSVLNVGYRVLLSTLLIDLVARLTNARFV